MIARCSIFLRSVSLIQIQALWVRKFRKDRKLKTKKQACRTSTRSHEICVLSFFERPFALQVFRTFRSFFLKMNISSRANWQRPK